MQSQINVLKNAPKVIILTILNVNHYKPYSDKIKYNYTNNSAKCGTKEYFDNKCPKIFETSKDKR